MNAKIREIVDALFQDVEMTEEARNLHDELCADLNDRLNDELADGVSEEAALAGIRAGLADFGELTREFPRRERALSVPQPDVVPMGEVREISVRLGMDDVSVVPSEDQQLHLAVTGDADARWRYELSEGRLALEIDRPEEETDTWEPDSISGSLLRALSELSRHIFRDIGRQPCHGEVRVPASWGGALTVLTGSGDVQVDLPVKALTVRTASGDIRLSLHEGCHTATVTAASGDIEARGTAETVTLNTSSGDIDLSGCVRQLRVSTASGDTRLMAVRADTLKYNATSGDLDMDGEAREIDFKTVSGDVELRLSGAVARIQGSAVSGDTEIALPVGQCAAAQTHSVSGDIQVGRPDGPGAARLKLSSVSGDIQVV